MSSKDKRERRPLNEANELPVEGIEEDVLSEIPAVELKNRAEYEENTGYSFETKLPIRRRRDEICETFGSIKTTYKDPEQLLEEGTVSVIGSINIGKFHTGAGKGFNVGYKIGFHSLQGKGFSIGTGVGFSYIPSIGFDIKFSSTGKEAFDPDGFDTAIDPRLPQITICNFP